jgi:hypothetical protein
LVDPVAAEECTHYHLERDLATPFDHTKT